MTKQKKSPDSAPAGGKISDDELEKVSGGTALPTGPECPGFEAGKIIKSPGVRPSTG